MSLRAKHGNLSFKIASSLTLLALTVTRGFFSGLNLTKRIWEHKNKLVQGVTEKYGVDKLVYYEQFEDAEYSLRREKNLDSPIKSGNDIVYYWNQPTQLREKPLKL